MQTTTIQASQLSTTDKVVNGEHVLNIWSIGFGTRSVLVTFDVEGQTKADSKVRYMNDATVTIKEGN